MLPQTEFTAYQAAINIPLLSSIVAFVLEIPMDKVQRPRPRKGEVQGKVEAYTVEELRRIPDGLEKEPLKRRAFLRLLIDTGIRRGECCALKWKDIDFKNETVTICGNLCYTPHKGAYLDTPKSGKARTIDVDPEVLKLLRQHQSEQASVCISQWVFTQEGTPNAVIPSANGWIAFSIIPNPRGYGPVCTPIVAPI